MDRVAVPTWLGCPVCRGPLAVSRVQDKVTLRCGQDGLVFEVRDGVFCLLAPGEAERAARFAEEYRQRRLQQGWQPPTVAEWRELPFKPLRGMGRVYWRVRQHSFRLLQTLVQGARANGELPPRPRAVDVGAGIGWLTRWLAAWGCDVVALDISVDAFFGLGAARRLCRAVGAPVVMVQGSMEHLPFQVNQVDLLVFNAALHYAADLPQTLRASAEVLRPKGLLVIMDTPIIVGFVGTPSQTWAGSRQLPWTELASALQEAGFTVARKQGGPWWWPLYQAWRKVRGEAVFELPFIVARLRHAGSAGV